MRPRVNSTVPEVIDLTVLEDDDISEAPLTMNVSFAANGHYGQPLRNIKQDPAADGEAIFDDSDHESWGNKPPTLVNQLLVPSPQTSPPEMMPPLNIQELIATAPSPFTFPPAKKQRNMRTTISDSQLAALRKSFVLSKGREIPITGLLALQETTGLPIAKIKQWIAQEKKKTSAEVGTANSSQQGSKSSPCNKRKKDLDHNTCPYRQNHPTNARPSSQQFNREPVAGPSHAMFSRPQAPQPQVETSSPKKRLKSQDEIYEPTEALLEERLKKISNHSPKDIFHNIKKHGFCEERVRILYKLYISDALGFRKTILNESLRLKERSNYASFNASQTEVFEKWRKMVLEKKKQKAAKTPIKEQLEIADEIIVKFWLPILMYSKLTAIPLPHAIQDMTFYSRKRSFSTTADNYLTPGYIHYHLKATTNLGSS